MRVPPSCQRHGVSQAGKVLPGDPPAAMETSAGSGIGLLFLRRRVRGGIVFAMDHERDVSLRLFIGLPMPRESAAVLAGADPGLRGLRWLEAAQLHLTLSFLGEVERMRMPGLQEALAKVHVPPFFLPLQAMGAFQSHGKPSVVWVGVGRGHPHLFALHKRVQDAVLQAGLEADLRPFHPHVTVGRGKGISRGELQPFLRKHAETEWGLLKVEEFILCSSRLSSEGAEHREELRVGLER